jgi:hypothetical protein
VRRGERRPLWQRVALGRSGLPAASAANTAITAVTATPTFAVDRTLYVATNSGVFVSRDRGDTYHPWTHAGLGPQRIIALAISPNFREDRLVFALELGGTVWQRRDA